MNIKKMNAELSRRRFSFPGNNLGTSFIPSSSFSVFNFHLFQYLLLALTNIFDAHRVYLFENIINPADDT